VWVALTLGALGAYGLAALSGYGFAIWVVSIMSAVMALAIFVPAFRNTGFRWRRASWCRAGLALVCAYLALACVMHRKALADLDGFVAANHLPGENRAALPLPPTLTHWAGVISTP